MFWTIKKNKQLRNMISEQKDIVHIKYTDILFTKNIKTR